MSTVYRYSIPQRLSIYIGQQLVRWAQQSAAASHERRTQRAEKQWSRLQSQLAAEKTREDAIRAYHLLPRQY